MVTSILVRKALYGHIRVIYSFYSEEESRTSHCDGSECERHCDIIFSTSHSDGRLDFSFFFIFKGGENT